jgi:hypothetical protein
MRVFGAPVRFLWLAANWLGFPRTTPHAGAVAVFGRHHVAEIEEVYGDGTAKLYDPNSGSHLTRMHRRSIARATIVQPDSLGHLLSHIPDEDASPAPQRHHPRYRRRHYASMRG